MYGSKSQLNCINVRSQSNRKVTKQTLFLSNRELRQQTSKRLAWPGQSLERSPGTVRSREIMSGWPYVSDETMKISDLK